MVGRSSACALAGKIRGASILAAGLNGLRKSAIDALTQRSTLAAIAKGAKRRVRTAAVGAAGGISFAARAKINASNSLGTSIRGSAA
jgi:hypothetical protein